jgi:threonine dehydratase
VVICEPGLPARLAATGELIAVHGYTLIPPFDDPAVIAGQGTIGLEIGTDCPQAGLVLVPISGGGLISGIAAAVRALCPDAVVIGVEPEHAADARDSLHQRQRVAWPVEETGRTLADALRVEQIGELPLAHMLAHVQDIITVTDGELRAAVRWLATRARLVAEPGGAAAVAAALFHAAELPAADVRVAVVSGGNIEPPQPWPGAHRLAGPCDPRLPIPPRGSCCSSPRSACCTWPGPGARCCSPWPSSSAG